MFASFPNGAVVHYSCKDRVDASYFVEANE